MWARVAPAFFTALMLAMTTLGAVGQPVPQDDREIDCRNPQDAAVCRELQQNGGRLRPPHAAAQTSIQNGKLHPDFNCAKAVTDIEQAICSDVTLAQWDARMGQLYRQALSIQNNSPTIKADQARWRMQRTRNCSGLEFSEIKSCVLEMTKARVGGLAAVVMASGGNPNAPGPAAAPVVYPSSPPAAPAMVVTSNPLSLPATPVEQAQSIAQAPFSAPSKMSSDTETNEAAFISVIVDARSEYYNGSNELIKGAARVHRRGRLCQVMQSLTVRGWTGAVANLSSSSGGKGVLVVSIAPNITIMTTNNDFSDSIDHTLIDPSSNVFSQVASLSKGQRILFSGSFLPNQTDCVREASMTQEGSMTDPEFLFHFADVKAAQ
jgi:uncharacterized protein YecT (DUF1311 family)